VRLGDRVRDFVASVVARSGFLAKALQIFYDRSTIPQTVDGSSTFGLHSNVLMSPVMWVMRAFTEAQLVTQRRREDSGGGIIWERVVDHPMETLIDRPNEAYDGDALWKATALSFTMAGNAYWRKVRNVYGDVVQLWYVPHWMIRPQWDEAGTTFISHYELSGFMGGPYLLPPRDVVHFRFGLDPENVRLGYSPLQSVLREVMTDDEAARFSEKILENMGVPGLVISPQKDAGFRPGPDEIKRLQAYFDTAFNGDRRGAALVMGGPTDVAQFGFDPNKLMLPNLRDISEERVCSAIGIPAAVVGFGSGLQSTKVGATMRELVKLAWVQCVTPMQTAMARQVTAQLLPDFVAQTRRFRARFDTTEVSAFQEEAKAEAERVALLVREGILRVDRAQHILGLEVDPSRAVYLKDEAPEPVAPDAAPSDDVDDDAPPPPADDDDPDEDETTKMLRAIAHRLPTLNGGRNGNGTH
jgi:HK97 family phage portal protein